MWNVVLIDVGCDEVNDIKIFKFNNIIEAESYFQILKNVYSNVFLKEDEKEPLIPTKYYIASIDFMIEDYITYRDIDSFVDPEEKQDITIGSNGDILSYCFLAFSKVDRSDALMRAAKFFDNSRYKKDDFVYLNKLGKHVLKSSLKNNCWYLSSNYRYNLTTNCMERLTALTKNNEPIIYSGDPNYHHDDWIIS